MKSRRKIPRKKAIGHHQPHNRTTLNLHESDFARLRLIDEAIKALDAANTENVSVAETKFNEKRLLAGPWAALCIAVGRDGDVGCLRALGSGGAGRADRLMINMGFQESSLTNTSGILAVEK